MSVDYLRLYVETAESAGNDVMPEVTQLSVSIDDADALVREREEIVAWLTDSANSAAATGERKAKLAKFKDLLMQQKRVEHAKSTACATIEKSFDESTRLLDREKSDYISGVYQRRDEKAERYARDLSPDREEGEEEYYSEEEVYSAAPLQQPVQRQYTQQSRGYGGKSKGTKRQQREEDFVEAPPKTKKSKGRGGNSKNSKKAARVRPPYCKTDCTEKGGDMVACDEEGCQFGCQGPGPYGEWFYLSCVGLKVPPAEDKKWFCKECRDAKKKRSKIQNDESEA